MKKLILCTIATALVVICGARVIPHSNGEESVRHDHSHRTD